MEIPSTFFEIDKTGERSLANNPLGLSAEDLLRGMLLRFQGSCPNSRCCLSTDYYEHLKDDESRTPLEVDSPDLVLGEVVTRVQVFCHAEVCQGPELAGELADTIERVSVKPLITP